MGGIGLCSVLTTPPLFTGPPTPPPNWPHPLSVSVALVFPGPLLHAVPAPKDKPRLLLPSGLRLPYISSPVPALLGFAPSYPRPPPHVQMTPGAPQGLGIRVRNALSDTSSYFRLCVLHEA